MALALPVFMDNRTLCAWKEMVLHRFGVMNHKVSLAKCNVVVNRPYLFTPATACELNHISGLANTRGHLLPGLVLLK